MNSEIDLRDIKKVIDLSDGSKVLLLDRLGKKDEYTKEERARNVYRVKADGSIIWQVKSKFDSDGGPFTNIQYTDGVLAAYRWDGGDYEIDIETGEATPKRFAK